MYATNVFLWDIQHDVKRKGDAIYNLNALLNVMSTGRYKKSMLRVSKTGCSAVIAKRN